MRLFIEEKQINNNLLQGRCAVVVLSLRILLLSTEYYKIIYTTDAYEKIKEQ